MEGNEQSDTHQPSSPSGSLSDTDTQPQEHQLPNIQPPRGHRTRQYGRRMLQRGCGVRGIGRRAPQAGP